MWGEEEGDESRAKSAEGTVFRNKEPEGRGGPCLRMFSGVDERK